MNNKHRHHIKSRARFTIFIAILVIFTVTSINTLIGLNSVSGEEKQRYVTVTVEQGDTLWTLADRYMPSNIDKRKAVYHISKLNALDGSGITQGQVIYVPLNHLD